jgi:acetoin utilization deacetylase AcuC-like enzyme
VTYSRGHTPQGPETASSPAAGLVYHPDYLLHEAGDWHPESPERLRAIVSHLDQVGLTHKLRLIRPEPAADDWILLVHSREHLEDLAEPVRGESRFLDADTRMSVDSYRVAKLAVGGALAAVDAVMAGEVRSAFCALRPPGHHALRDRAMGFCLFNNIAVAARYAQRRHGLERVLIADWDVHHGNGTQAIFYEDPTVFYFSTHQYPFYPGTGASHETGAGRGKGCTLNVPLASGSGDQEIIGAFRDRLVPAAEAFQPQIVLISAGFDAHRDDPLAQLRVTEAGYSELTRIVVDLADRFAGGRLVSLLEGGYNLQALARSVEAHLRALAEPPGVP